MKWSSWKVIPMEIKIKEENKKRIRLELTKADQGLINALKEVLWNDKHVNVAGSNIEHPLIDKLYLTIETDGKEAPKKALLAAIMRLKATNDKFKKAFVKVAK